MEIERKKAIHEIGKQIERSIEDIVFTCTNAMILKYGNFTDEDYDLLIKYYRHYDNLK